MTDKKDFYLKFNIKDFKTDRKLCNCTAESAGVYIFLMCLLFDCDERGKYPMKSDCLKNFADILPRQNIQQNNQQIFQQIKNICCCIAEQLSKHLPFTIKEIERGLTDLLENDVIYTEGYYLCQKRMIKDAKTSISRSKTGKLGAAKTNAKTKPDIVNPIPPANELADNLPQQNNQQNNQQNPNYNYNYNSIDNKGGIGNTEGVQGAENLGGKEDERIPDFVAGNWNLEIPTKDCLKYFSEHADFNDDRIFCFECFYKKGIQLPFDELLEKTLQWGKKFNEITEGEMPKRSMRGYNSWVQHFRNYISKRDLTENPLKIVTIKSKDAEKKPEKTKKTAQQILAERGQL